MRRFLAIVMAFLALSSTAQAMSATQHLAGNYLATRSVTSQRTDVNLDEYLKRPILPVDNKYIESKDGLANYTIGKQTFTLGDGLVAGIYDVCGIRVSLENGGRQASFFYGDDGQLMQAGNVRTSYRQKKLTLEASYFKIDSPFAGITVSGRLNPNEVVNIETSENLQTQSKGFLIRMSYGQAQRKGDVYATLAYRYVEPGAVSAYSANADFDDSKGVKLEATYKIKDDVALALTRDIAMTHDGFDKSAANATLTWDF